MKHGRFYLYESKQCLWSHVAVATSFIDRLTGLTTRAGLPRQEALWLPACSAIQTWRMQFAIDLIGLDQAGHICRVRRNIQPGGWVHLAGVHSVLECEAGCHYPLEKWLHRRLQFVRTERGSW